MAHSRSCSFALRNSDFADAIPAALVIQPLARQYRTLDLSLGTMTDDGAHALVAARSSLPLVQWLDVSHNYLSDVKPKHRKGNSISLGAPHRWAVPPIADRSRRRVAA